MAKIIQPDPQRPLLLAIRSTRLLGIVFTLLGGLVVAMTGGLPVLSGRGGVALLAALMGLILLVPGILYIVFAIFLTRRQTWAVTATIVLASIHGLFAVFSFVATCLSGAMLQIVLTGLWVAALGQLIYHLSQSFNAIRIGSGYTARGFEPLPVNRETPPTP